MKFTQLLMFCRLFGYYMNKQINRWMDRQTLTSSMIPREVFSSLAWSCLSEKRTRLYHERRLVRNVPTRSLSEVMWFSMATIYLLDRGSMYMHNIYLIMSSYLIWARGRMQLSPTRKSTISCGVNWTSQAKLSWFISWRPILKSLMMSLFTGMVFLNCKREGE